MASPFPSDEWIEACRERLNDTEEYAENGQGRGVGFDDDVAFHVRADDRLAGDLYFFIGLEDGGVHRGARSRRPGRGRRRLHVPR
jgi:hypothetical protein